MISSSANPINTLTISLPPQFPIGRHVSGWIEVGHPVNFLDTISLPRYLSAGWPRQVHQQAKRLTVVSSHNPAAYRRSKRPSGLPAGLGPANMFSRQFGG